MRGRKIDYRTKVTSCLLAALLMLGFPGPALVLGATPAAPSASGSLSVDSDPAGAVVLLDGQARGTTPLALQALPAGDHRVRVVKEGYLDNSRVVRVGGGQTEKVRVRLTPTATATQVEKPPEAEKQGGSKKKWLFIGLGAVAAGTAFYVLTKNSPPVAGTIGVSPTGTGMAGVTSFTFTSQGSSDPDGDSLTYEWAFGDGGTGSGQSTTHVYSAEGSYNVTLTVKDNKHSVSAPGASVSVGRSMAGVWSGGTTPGFGGSFSVNLTQSGTTLGGSITYVGNLSGTASGLTGSVGGTTYPATVNISTPTLSLSSGISMRQTFSGSTDSSGSSMTGTATVTLFGGFFTATGSPVASVTTTLRR